jgi:hypothetical protein
MKSRAVPGAVEAKLILHLRRHLLGQEGADLVPEVEDIIVDLKPAEVHLMLRDRRLGSRQRIGHS